MPDFAALFGAPPAAVASAPGRVNLIGEHTDYNGGHVLPIAIPQRTTAEVRPAPGGRVRVRSETVGEEDAFELGSEARGGTWVDYVKGLTRVLAAAHQALGGFDLRVASDVPVGSGLSSSAALSVAVLRALRQAFRLELDDLALAQLAQRSENEFVGAPVGIMDPMAASFADPTTALYLDTRSLAFERLPLPPGAGLVVIDSAVPHAHAQGGYRTRRAECARAAELLGVAALRDVPPSDLERVAALPAPLDRRARHVVTEERRVADTVGALRQGDLARAGRLLSASHASLRDDFEVSVPEIDLLVSLAEEQPGVHGARLTGGGFGGSIVALADARHAQRVADAVTAAYAARTGLRPRTLVPAGTTGEGR